MDASERPTPRQGTAPDTQEAGPPDFSPAGPGDPAADEVGLRERKKRQTRQRISDVATEMFIARGYDEVKVAEIAEASGVSEKTVYNYFPAKESLVFDRADEQRRRLTAAVRERDPDTSAADAFTLALKAMMADMWAETTEQNAHNVIAFAEMIRSTPALRAAAGEHRHLLVDDLTQILAANYRIDPREAEIVTAARAVTSLLELCFDSNLRHVEDGLTGPELRATVEADIDRGTRLVATGLWSLQVLVDERRGAGATGPDESEEQASEPRRAEREFDPDHVRAQVISALREATSAWRAFSEDAVAAGREIQEQARSGQNGDYSYVRELARQRAQELKERAREIGQAQKQAAREAAKEAQREAREARDAQRSRRKPR